MLMTTQVGIYIKGNGEKDSHGSWVENEVFVKNIYVDIQPYSTQLLLNQYGYNIEVNKRVFIDHYDSDIKIGTVLKYENLEGVTESYEVKVIPWDDGYMEVMAYGLQE